MSVSLKASHVSDPNNWMAFNLCCFFLYYSVQLINNLLGSIEDVIPRNQDLMPAVMKHSSLLSANHLLLLNIQKLGVCW